MQSNKNARCSSSCANPSNPKPAYTFSLRNAKPRKFRACRVRDYKAKTAAVIGSGTMGGGISMALANGGVDVTVIDLEEALVQRAKETIARNYESTFKKGRLSQEEMDRRLGRLHFATSLDAVADVDLIIEAVFEEMDVKKDIFRKIDKLARPDAILATNTSTLDIDAIASVTSRPERVIGTHFFSPANVMKLLEIVRGAKTSPELIGDALSLAKQLGKVGVVSGNCDGFIGNRMLAHYRREADFLLEEGALAAANRSRHPRVRISDGPIRDGRSSRPGHQLARP